MTDEILVLMKERRIAEATYQNKYRELRNRIRFECRQAKKTWIKVNAGKMKELI